eukprot:8855081-Prorocentrum_lima.AAC.1
MVCPIARMLARSVASVLALSIRSSPSANLSAAQLQWMLCMGGRVRYGEGALTVRERAGAVTGARVSGDVHRTACGPRGWPC